MAAAAGAGGPTGGTGSASTGGAAGSSGGALMSVGSLLLEGGGGGGGSSLGFGIGGGGSSAGGATPMAVRPTQRLPGLTSSSDGLAPVLRDIMARCHQSWSDVSFFARRLTGPPEALGLPAGCSGRASGSDAAAVGVGLLPLFHWFLVLLDQLLAHWQLSWNRRWRVSTWWSQLVQQPFNRAFLVPLECPFDPADNAAKSLGCENQPKHQQVLRGLVAEVGASLRLLRAARSPEDLDRLIQGMFGLEVEHLYLEEEEEEAVLVEREVGEAEEEAGPDVEGEEEEAALGWAAERPQRAQSEDEVAAEAQGHEPQDPGAADPGGAGTSAAPPAAAGGRGSAGDARSPVTQVRLLRADEPSKPQRAGSPAAAVGTPFAISPVMPGEGAPRSGGGKASGKGKSKAVAGQRSRASPAAGAAVAAAATAAAGATQLGHGMAEEEAGLGFDIEAVRVEKVVDDVVDDGAAAAGGGDSGRRGRRRQAAAAADSPPLPTSSAAMVKAASPAVLRANARVQRPLSPLLRDVTNARQYGSQSGPEPKQPGPGPSAATAATAAAGPSTSAASTSAAMSRLIKWSEQIACRTFSTDILWIQSRS